MKDYIKRIYFTAVSFLIIFIIFKTSMLFLKLGMNDTATQIFYVIGGLFLGYSFVEYMKVTKGYNLCQLEYYERISRIFGKIEGNVTPIQGVTLKDNDEVLDSIVITSKGVFNIIGCSYVGDIIIKEDGNWYKRELRGEYILPSPLNKIRKNREILSSIYEDKDIIDVVVMLSDFGDVSGGENFQIPILKSDELNGYIEEYEVDEYQEEEGLYDKLYKNIKEVKDLEKIKLIYRRYLDLKWKFRGRLAVLSIFCVLYLLNVIYS